MPTIKAAKSTQTKKQVSLRVKRQNIENKLEQLLHDLTTGLITRDEYEYIKRRYNEQYAQIQSEEIALRETMKVAEMQLRSAEPVSYTHLDPDYAGIAELYHRFEDNTELTRVFSGVWRMEDDCLRLDLSAGVGSSLSGSFPILISPSGEEMHFQRSRSGEGVPFLPDNTDSIDLTRSYG